MKCKQRSIKLYKITVYTLHISTRFVIKSIIFLIKKEIFKKIVNWNRVFGMSRIYVFQNYFIILSNTYLELLKECGSARSNTTMITMKGSNSSSIFYIKSNTFYIAQDICNAKMKEMFTVSSTIIGSSDTFESFFTWGIPPKKDNYYS